MDIKVPKNSLIYIFGSFLSKSEPNDLDILFIYDSNFVKSEHVFIENKVCIEILAEYFGLKIDVVYLTHDENKNSDFLYKVKAVDYRECSKFKDINFVTS